MCKELVFLIDFLLLCFGQIAGSCVGVCHLVYQINRRLVVQHREEVVSGFVRQFFQDGDDFGDLLAFKWNVGVITDFFAFQSHQVVVHAHQGVPGLGGVAGMDFQRKLGAVIGNIVTGDTWGAGVALCFCICQCLADLLDGLSILNQINLSGSVVLVVGAVGIVIQQEIIHRFCSRTIYRIDGGNVWNDRFSIFGVLVLDCFLTFFVNLVRNIALCGNT